MPELPEVETMRRGVAVVVGGQIISIEAPRSRLRPIAIEPRLGLLRRRCQGRVIRRAGRIGKRVTLELEDAGVLIFEPRMTGLLLVADPPGPEHVRLRIGLSQCPVDRLLYWDRRGLGSVRLLAVAEVSEQLAAKLGPDALEMTAEMWGERLGRSRRAVKVALLDQRAAAGIGNLYASEILHQAGVDPRRVCAGLTLRHWRRIDRAVRDVLSEAIRLEGSTLSDGTYRSALNTGGGYQNRHRVYDRAGRPCTSCGRAVVRIIQAQRSTFFCPRCQR